MQNGLKIIKRPVLSEKSTVQAEKDNKVVFEVAAESTKTQIRAAVESFFKVKVKAVNTVRLPGKAYRTKSGDRKTATWKKAIVTLKQGEKIEFFKGV